MTDERYAATVRVEALEPDFAAAANTWAARLGLAQHGEAGFALQVGADGLQLVELVEHGPGPVRVDFVEGAAAHRRSATDHWDSSRGSASRPPRRRSALCCGAPRVRPVSA